MAIVYTKGLLASGAAGVAARTACGAGAEQGGGLAKPRAGASDEQQQAAGHSRERLVLYVAGKTAVADRDDFSSRKSSCFQASGRGGRRGDAGATEAAKARRGATPRKHGRGLPSHCRHHPAASTSTLLRCTGRTGPPCTLIGRRTQGWLALIGSRQTPMRSPRMRDNNTRGTRAAVPMSALAAVGVGAAMLRRYPAPSRPAGGYPRSARHKPPRRAAIR